MAMLEVKDLNVYYGAIHAIKNISFEVNEGEIITLIGANGAGKTTTLHAVSGVLKPKSGSIHFCGKEITHTDAYKIPKLGLAQVPEGRRVFANMTVMENLEMGAYIRNGKENLNEEYERIFERLPRLKERRKQAAGTLSGGEQQMLALGRALMTNGSLLMLDEPSMGLAPIIVEEIFKIIRQINESGTSILLIEQNAFLALTTASHAYVLETGKITMQGKSSDLLADKRVKDAYLGA